MVFIRCKNQKVNFIHYMPFDSEYGMGKTVEELKQEGLLLENIPEPELIKGKLAILHCDPSTKELWYEYEDIPKTEEQVQQQKIQELENALLEMSTLQAIKDIENEQAIMELTTMITMIGGM